MRVAALAVVPRVIRVLSRIHQAEAESPAPVATDQRIEELAPIVASPARVRKTPTKRLQIFNSVKRKSPPLWAWRAPSRSQAPPLHFGGSRSWAYLHRRSFPINTVDPDGLLPEGGGGAVLRGLTNFARGIGRAGMAAAENPNTWRVIGTGARAAGAAAALPEVVAGAAAGYAAEAAWTYGTTYPAQQVLTKGAQFSNETMRLMNDGRRAVQTGRGLNCPQVADAILKDFQAQGIDAKIVEIYVEDKHGFIVRDGIKNTISNDGTHRLVEAEGRLYDAFSGQSGIPRSQWRRYYDGATPINIR